LSLLSSKRIESLKERKNLLAFSAGIDSSALFFLMVEAGIDFDIAMVNYQSRTASDLEAAHARKLAKQYGKRCYIQTIRLPDANFEHEARRVRYAFFEKIIADEGYETLITAHQLNDRLEWMLMQLCKGAGLVEMVGFDEIEERDGYTIVRPLLEQTKERLLDYLQKKSLPYFTDESNLDTKYRRNYFRQNFATPLLTQYEKGIRESFRYMQKDKAALFSMQIIEHVKAYYVLKRDRDDTHTIRQVDKILKRLGYILSAAQKREILHQRASIISDRFAVVITDEKIYIAPHVRAVMPKPFKEACRMAGIPPKVRPYLYSIGYKVTERMPR
jgi:tRNA(Ile)-lysidine synthase